MKSFKKVLIDNLKFSFCACAVLLLLLTVIFSILAVLSWLVPVIGNDAIYTAIIAVVITVIVTAVALSIYQWVLLRNNK